jgi:uncharacterized protein with HEPN domain
MLAPILPTSSYTDGMSFEDFLADERTLDAVVRNLEIIGEAAKYLRFLLNLMNRITGFFNFYCIPQGRVAEHA